MRSRIRYIVAQIRFEFGPVPRLMEPLYPRAWYGPSYVTVNKINLRLPGAWIMRKPVDLMEILWQILDHIDFFAFGVVVHTHIEGFLFVSDANIK